MPKRSGAMQCMLLTALFSSMGVHAAVTDTQKLQEQPVSVVADTQSKVRREGSVNVGGINWLCSGVRCNTMASATAVPLALCQGLARELGALRSFSFANRPLNGNELQQCNSAAPAAVAVMPSIKTPQGAGLPPAAPVPSVGLLPLQAPPRLDKAVGFATPQAPSPLMADPVKKKMPDSIGAAPTAPGMTLLDIKPIGRTRDLKLSPALLSSRTTATTGTVPSPPVEVTTGPLSMTGRFGTLTISTGPLTMTGRFGTLTITTSPLSMTGSR